MRRSGFLMLAIALTAVTLAPGCAPAPEKGAPDEAPGLDSSAVPRTYPPDPREVHLSELTMLTDGGENAEAYFSFNGAELVFQSTRPPYGCDQIFTIPVAGGQPRPVSTGSGRTTCAYFLPGDDEIVYSSTHLGGADCPPTPNQSRGYVWPIYPSYDIFRARADGSGLVRLTDTPGYDAEATVSPRGDRIVFTSMRDGDLDIYTMRLDGSGLEQVTFSPEFDGFPMFAPDGKAFVFGSNRHNSQPGETNIFVTTWRD